MTDKEIIIDGVNVENCMSFLVEELENLNTLEKEYEMTCLEYEDGCADNPNCLYKQLARKTQECEELKEKNKLLLIKGQDGISKREWAYKQCRGRADRYKQALDKIEDRIQDIDLSTENNVLVLNDILAIIQRGKE